MSSARQWAGKLILRSPAGVRALRKVPVLGGWIHRLSHSLLPSEERLWARIEAGPAEGLWFELNPRTGQHYLRGEAEAEVQNVLAERLHPGMIFYDLGANIGLLSILAARAVGPAGRVFSFEPDAEGADRLRRNVRRNDFANVTVIEAGVWSASGLRTFVAADQSSPDHGTGHFMAGTGEPGTPVRCVALDDFIRDAPPPNAMKCDVEGAEVEVFRGAGKLLQTHRPWILCEMHSDANERAFRELLQRFAYTFQRVDDGHLLALP